MNASQIAEAGDELYRALCERRSVPPLTDRFAAISLEDAYAISQHLLALRLQAGERVVGKKTGATSEAVQSMLNVDQPDFGFLTDAMAFREGQDVPISERLIQPRAEGEVAFVLKSDLDGPGVTPEQVLAATDYVVPCFEIVDSRIHDWQIKIQDTVADNASSGLFLLGDERVDPGGIDWTACEMVVEKNGSYLSRGTGAAAMGSPLHCVAWLANTLGVFGIPLSAGEVILSGSLVPLEPVKAGDSMRLTIDAIGSVSVRFT